MICDAFDRADDESGEIVFAVGVEAGHLRGLAANQRAAVLLARARDPSTICSATSGDKLAGRQVVEEEQRRRALNQDVVDAVVHEVRADRVVPPVMNATLSLVPTPSALETSTGSRHRADRAGTVRRTIRCRRGRRACRCARAST